MKYVVKRIANLGEKEKQPQQIFTGLEISS